jgi:iron complex outermembrane receptor protein
MENATRPRLSRLCAAVTIALAGAHAGISTAQPQPQTQEQLEEITVTGSRIQRESGFSTAVPLTAVTPADLESLKPGATIADQLDQLPQFFQTQSAQRGGGALFGGAGRSVIDLRAMGPQRTLVLLDGARLAPADRDGSVHVDNIPTALISQIEVVTGGASAAYGADALAGVTNFRLNRTFDGMDFSASFGETADNMGANRGVTWAYGTETGERGHLISSLEYQKIDPIDYDPLELGDWFRRYGIVANPAWTAGNLNQPQRLVLPDVHSRQHTPTGRIGGLRNAANVALTPAQTAAFPFAGQTFTYDGRGVRPFQNGNVIGAATNNQSGGPEADIANQAFGGGPYGAEVERQNAFFGYTFDANDSTRYFMNLLGGRTQSNDYDQRGIPHLASPWTTQIFVDNAYLPANVRAAMRANNVASFVMEKQGTVLGQPGNWGDSEDRHNQYDSWTLQLGLDKDIGERWQMQARFQRGATDRFTEVSNEIRVDREMLAIDAVEVYADRRDLTNDAGTGGPDGRPDLITDALRGTGTIVCNVQRYNPTPAQLQQSVAHIRVPAAQGDDSLAPDGDPLYPVPIPSPVGPDAIPNCVPMNIFGQGNVSPAAQEYVVSGKYGKSAVTQEFAELLFTGDIWDGYGPGTFSMAAGVTYREQWFWQRGYPQDIEAYGPPLNVDGLSPLNGNMNLGIRGIQGGFTTGSPNLHEFSTVPTIKGGYDVWETFTEFNMPLWQAENSSQRLEVDVAARRSDYSTSGVINSWKTGINLQVAEFLRFRSTVSRDVREPTFNERFDVQGGGGSISENAVNGIPTGNNTGTATTFQITTTAIGNPDLTPEEADTITAGFIVEPQQTGLQFSVDWYDIDLADAIGQLGVQRIVDECRAAPGSQFCTYVFRDPLTNAVTAVRNPWLNINNARVRGLDYEVLWNKDTDWFGNRSEAFTLRLLAGRLLEDSTTTPGGQPVDLAGQLNEPENRAVATLRYQLGEWGFSLQRRYFGESEINLNTVTMVQFVPGMPVPAGRTTLDDATVDAKGYTDLTVSYERELNNGRAWQLALAITNASDEDPPVIATFDQRFSAQTNPANAYDVYGRRFLATFSYKL